MRKTVLLLLCFVAACGGGSSSTTGPTGGTTNGTFTATIDGQAWVSTTNQTATSSSANAVPGSVTLTGTKVVSATNYTTITLALGYLTGPGTYPLGVNQGTTAGGTGIVFATVGSAISTWSTNLLGNAGTVTITSLTSSRIAGTLQFTAPPQSFSSQAASRHS